MEKSLVETLKLAGWVDWVEPRCRRLSRVAGKGLVDQLWPNGSNRIRKGNLGIMNYQGKYIRDKRVQENLFSKICKEARPPRQETSPFSPLSSMLLLLSLLLLTFSPVLFRFWLRCLGSCQCLVEGRFFLTNKVSNSTSTP